MKFTIKNIYNEVLFELEAETFLKAIEQKKADLSGAYLSGADLSGADLYGADLSGANLSGATLSGATLRGADLSWANLSWANLSWATLRGADLSGATLPTGIKWETYLTELVPALLIAGGKTLREVVSVKTWNCHVWKQDGLACPMAVAFDAVGINEIPVLYRQLAKEFIQYFDNELIPMPLDIVFVID
jgi:hypothetical protein